MITGSTEISRLYEFIQSSISTLQKTHFPSIRKTSKINNLSFIQTTQGVLECIALEVFDLAGRTVFS
jgi:hypothetical protein